MPKALRIVVADEKDAANIKKLVKYLPKKKLHRLYVLISRGAPIPLACKGVGISVKIVKALLRDIPQFKEYIEEAEEVALAKVEHKVLKQAMRGHFPSQHFILTHTTSKYAPPAQKIQQEIKTASVMEHKGIVVKIARPKRKKKVIDAEYTVKETKALPETP
jgi:hypothetical protein